MPSVRALRRGLRLLMHVVDSDQPLGVNELSRRLELPKGTVSRLLSTLVDEGYVACSPLTGLYSAGRELVWRLTGARLDAELLTATREALIRLRDVSGETAALYVPVWPERVCIEQVQSRSGLRRIHELGERWALTRGAGGRAYLAFATEEEVERTLQARPLDPGSPYSDPDRFRAALAQIRQDGYAVALSEHIVDGMSGMAAPVFRPGKSEPVAMLSIAGPEVRWNREAMTRVAPVMVEIAAQLSRQLEQ